jgi:hypothetical protein
MIKILLTLSLRPYIIIYLGVKKLSSSKIGNCPKLNQDGPEKMLAQFKHFIIVQME